MKCSEIMTKVPECCLPSTTVDELAQIMASTDVGSVPIVESLESKKILGILTDRDLALRVVANGLDPRLTPVAHILPHNQIRTCKADDDINTAIALMEDYSVRRIPIVDEKKQLLGILTISDIISKTRNHSKTLEVIEMLSCCHEPKYEFPSEECQDGNCEPELVAVATVSKIGESDGADLELQPDG